MKYLKQGDPFWAGKTMGDSYLTLGRWGCTTTCVAMLSDYFGCYKSPLEIASNINNYTTRNHKLGGGLIIWKNLSFEKMEFAWREYGLNRANINAALGDPDRAVILEVNNRSHWVVAVGTNWLNRNDYMIIDPIDGKKKSLFGTYPNITGAAYFKRKDTPLVPEPVKKNDNYEIKNKLIKSDVAAETACYVFDGLTKYPIPTWGTFTLLFGEDTEIENVPKSVIDQIPTGALIPLMNKYD